MSRWFRVDDGLVDDPKVHRLGDRLFRAMINLWCVTSQNGGNFPSAADIAFKLRTSPAKAEALVADLRGAGLIDDDDHGTRPHNWNSRQFKSDITDSTAAERQQRYRNKRRNATVTPTVTVTDTITEQNRTEGAPEGAVGVYEFESGVIRLTERDFNRWKKSFSYLDLPAELEALAPWAAKQSSWYIAVSGALGKRNRDEKFRREQAKKVGDRPLTSSGNPWPDGII